MGSGALPGKMLDPELLKIICGVVFPISSPCMGLYPAGRIKIGKKQTPNSFSIILDLAFYQEVHLIRHFIAYLNNCVVNFLKEYSHNYPYFNNLQKDYS